MVTIENWTKHVRIPQPTATVLAANRCACVLSSIGITEGLQLQIATNRHYLRSLPSSRISHS